MPILRAKPTFFLLLAFFACDKQSPHEVRPQDPDLPIVRTEEVATLGLAAPQCQAIEPGTPHILATTVTRWQQGRLVQNPLDIGGLSVSGSPLSTPSIAQVMINAVFRRTCGSGEAAPPECILDGHASPGWRQVTPGTPLKICSPTAAPTRDSLEHQAMVALITVEKAAQMIKPHMPPNRPLGKLTILASPRFESLWTPWQVNGSVGAYEMLFADNLAYFGPTSSTPPYLALLPARERNSDKPYLWELPFVVAHEFGHHVESTLGVDHFSQQRSLTRQAVSEGFADLIGFAAHGGPDADPLLGVPCFAADRSPSSAKFSGGAAKAVTTGLLRQVASASSKTLANVMTAQCQGVLPHSSHGLGAIFAFWVRELASLTPDFHQDPRGNLIDLGISWLLKTEERLGAGTAIGSGAGTDVNTTAKEIQAVADGLEAMIQKRFADTGQQIPEETRILMRQKMREGFTGISGGEWFDRTRPSI